MSQFRLDGKRALITGSSKGIGLGIAQAYAEAGADVVLLARKMEELNKAKEQVAETGQQVDTVAFDLHHIKEIATTFDRIVSDIGEIDILVNNAGMTRRAVGDELPLEYWQEVIDVNLSAVFACCQAFAKERIAKKKSGRILNIASLMSHQTRRGVSAYTASKGGVKQLTQALSLDWARHGILVNAIGPGYIYTPLNKTLADDPKFDAWVKKRCPLGRWGTPADIASAAVFLVSEASSFITGQILYVDGGWLASF